MSKFKFAQTALYDVPESSGVYLFLDDKSKPIYVGKAKNLKKRISTYFAIPPKYKKIKLIQERSQYFEVIVTPDEHEAFLLENQLIKKHQPIYNILLKDDKTFPYIFISNHDFPRIDMTRKLHGKAKHYGPYVNIGAVKNVLEHVKRAFKIRSCRDYFFKQRKRPCLQYQIKRCSAPCVGYISKEDYAKQIEAIDQFLKGDSQELITKLETDMDKASKDMNYELAAQLRDQLKELNYIQSQTQKKTTQDCMDCFAWTYEDEILSIYHVRLVEGAHVDAKGYILQANPLLNLDEMMTQFFVRFYEAPMNHRNGHIYLSPQLRHPKQIETLLRKIYQYIRIPIRYSQDIRETLKNAELNRAMTVEVYKREKNKDALLHALMSIDDFAWESCRIECYDISHQQGRFTCASCVVFNELGPLKKDYRKYNLEVEIPGDDYEAMHEVIKRRYQKDRPLADLIIIDGGKGQLKRCIEALDGLNLINYRIISIAKGAARKVGQETFYDYKDGLIKIFEPSIELKQFLLWARDEAHRYAISHTRKKLTKLTVASKLEDIEGIGVAKRRQLLKAFGGLQGLLKADANQISKVSGIGKVLAKKIIEALK